MAQTQKEILRDTILLKMHQYLDTTVMEMLRQVLTEALYKVDVVEMQTLPATKENTNEYILNMFEVRKSMKLSDKTVTFYLETMTRFCDAVNKSLVDVSEMDVEMYLQQYRRKGVQPRTVNNALKVISAFYTWMCHVRLVDENPCEGIEKYKEIEKPVDHMEDWEIEVLRDACKGVKDRAVLEVLRSTAVRVGELISINRADIDWNTGNVIVYGEKNRKYRTVCLDDTARYHLKKYIDSRKDSEPALFAAEREPYKRLERSGIRAILKEIRKNAGLERRVYPHLFRKTTATNMVRRGCPRDLVALYLGHANGDTKTLNKHYVATDPQQVIQAFRRYGAA